MLVTVRQGHQPSPLGKSEPHSKWPGVEAGGRGTVPQWLGTAPFTPKVSLHCTPDPSGNGRGESPGTAQAQLRGVGLSC